MTTPDTLLVLLAAVVLDSYIGAPLRRRGWRWHPLVAAARATEWCSVKLNRRERPAGALRFRGGLCAAVFAIAATGGGVLLQSAASEWPLLWLAVLFLMTGLIEQREGADALKALGQSLAKRDRSAAETALAELSTRDPVYLDTPAMARTAINAAARSLARNWTAPVLYAALFGTPGIVGYRLFDGLAAVDRNGPFGAVPRKLRRVLRWAPDRLTGLLIAAAAPRRRQCLAALANAPGGVWPSAAMAAVLGISLGGPQRYLSGLVDRPWIGSGRVRAGPDDIAGAHRLQVRVVLIVALILGASALIGIIQGRP